MDAETARSMTRLSEANVKGATSVAHDAGERVE